MSPITKTDFLGSVAKPDRDGYSVLTELGERSPVVLIVHLIRALDVGALQLVFASDVHIPAESLARDKRLAPQPDEKRFANDGSRVSPSDLGLTERQLEVLALVMQAKRNKAICRVLNLAEPTVKNHVTAILRALGVSTRTEAVIAVGKLGWKLPTVTES
jgi:DNA-binding NarL/FixJ family response regulator